MTIERICVFCGSNPGSSPAYLEAARATGRLLAERGIGLVFGGGRVGMMGEIADTVLAGGGEVIGVIPKALGTKEIAHDGLTEMHVVETMHERKAMMAGLADAFLALPGGLGTLEEICEMLTWAQLGIHRKPCGVLDVEGFFTPLAGFLDHAVSQGFVAPEHRGMLVVRDRPGDVLAAFEAYVPPDVPKWLDWSGT